MSTTKFCRIAATMGILLLFSALAPAQTVNSIVIGRVVDPANAVVAGAAVTLTDQNTGAVRTAVTDGNGFFRFPDVFPSTYNLSVQMKGFKTHEVNSVVVSASETHELGTL